jgi:hypothetical protein
MTDDETRALPFLLLVYAAHACMCVLFVRRKRGVSLYALVLCEPKQT